MASTVNIKGVNKADLLVRLWDKSCSLGTEAFLSIVDAEQHGYSMHDMAELYLDKNIDVGVFMGRPVYANLGHEEVDPSRYDRNAGAGVFARVVEEMRAEPVPWVNIEGVDKPTLLIDLWQNGRTRGNTRGEDMDPHKRNGIAGMMIDHDPHVEFFFGRIIDVDFSRAEVDPRVYDRENGQGALAELVQKRRDNPYY